MHPRPPIHYDARLRRLKQRLENELELMKRGELLPMKIWLDHISPCKPLNWKNRL